MKLDIPRYNLFVYPDMMVVCGRSNFLNRERTPLKTLSWLIEVLSLSTGHAFDRGKKFTYIRSVLSIQEYVLVSQDEPMVEAFYKQDEKTWTYTVVRGLEETITFQTIQHEFALKDIYQKIEWEPAMGQAGRENTGIE